MANDTSLLLRIRGDSSGGKTAVAETRAAISSLRQTSTTEFNQMQRASTVALGSIQSSITSLTSRVPVLGGTLSSLTSELSATAGASTQAGGAVAALGGPVGLAIAGVALLTVGITSLGTALFNLTKTSADFVGKFQDLSQQVGLSVETLSTLDVAASTTGGNIETVASSMVIFQKHLEAAHDPTSKEAKLLKELGVTSLDTETALRQVIKGLFDLGVTQKQTDNVTQLFGRSGKFVNAILKEYHGNLDEATEAFAKMGLGISSASAAMADEFNDSFGLMQRQLAAIGIQITQDVIPVFTVLFQEISQGLSGNKDDWKDWSNFVAFEVAAAIAAVKTFVQFVASRGTLSLGSLFEGNIEGILGESQKLRNKLNFDADIERIQRLTASILAGKPGDGTGTAKKAGADPEIARAARENALEQQKLEEAFRVSREVLERERALDLKSIEEWVKESEVLLGKRLADQQKGFQQEIENANRFIKNRRDRDLVLREIEQKDTKAQNDYFLGVAKIQDEAKKKREQSALRIEQQLLAIEDERRRAQLEIIRAALERQRILESDAIDQQIKLLTEAFEQRKILSDLELAQETTSTERRVELTNEKIAAEIRFTSEVKRLTQERIEASLREGAAVISRPGGGQGVPKPEDFHFDDSVLGPAPKESLQSLIDQSLKAGGAFQGLGVVMSEAFGLGESGALAFGDSLSSVFGQVAVAVGEVVRSFVLLGTAGGSFRKIAAEVIASIAQQATIQAIYEAAQGLAMLALTYFTGNPKYALSAGAHFAAAAAYGLIAGVAIPLGRKVAGDEFGQSGGGASGSSGAPQPLETIQTGRNQREPRMQQIHIVLHSNLGELDRVITASVVRNIGDGGDIREVLASDGRMR